MDVFVFRDRLIGDYASYIRSFIWLTYSDLHLKLSGPTSDATHEALQQRPIIITYDQRLLVMGYRSYLSR